jgi:hypothetical protein
MRDLSSPQASSERTARAGEWGFAAEGLGAVDTISVAC